MATNWQNNNLSSANTDSMTTMIDMGKEIVKLDTHASIFPPIDQIGSIQATGHGVSVNLLLDQMSFSTSDSVSGKLILDCPKKKVKLGKIEVRVFGFQDVRVKKAKNQQKLLYSHIYNIQSPRTPPSDAVFPGPIDEDGCWLARPGTIGFDFSIPLSKDEILESSNSNLQVIQECSGPIPSSVWKKKVGGIRHIVAAIVHYKTDILQTPLGKYQDISVFEQYQTNLNSFWFLPTSMTASSSVELTKGLIYKSKGELKLSVGLRTRETEACTDSGLWIAGNVGYIHTLIENTTHREVKRIQLSLIKRFKTFKEITDEAGQVSPQPMELIREVVVTRLWDSSKVVRKSGKNILKEPLSDDDESKKSVKEWQILPGESRNMMLELEIPSFCRSIRFATMVDVSFVVGVKVLLKGGKFTECEVPVTILNCRSVMSYSPLLSLKSTKEAEENTVVENLLPQKPEGPATLSKAETLTESSFLESCKDDIGRKSLESFPTLKKEDNRYSTIGSRRLDSIRFKEGSKSLRSYSLPRGSAPPVTSLKNEGIEAEIDNIFQTVF